MDIQARIMKILPPREGKSEKGEWSFTPIIIEWDEETPRGPLTHSAKIELNTNRWSIDKLKECEGKSLMLLPFSLSISVRKTDNGSFNDINAWPIGDFRNVTNSYEGY